MEDRHHDHHAIVNHIPISRSYPWRIRRYAILIVTFTINIPQLCYHQSTRQYMDPSWDMKFPHFLGSSKWRDPIPHHILGFDWVVFTLRGTAGIYGWYGHKLQRDSYVRDEEWNVAPEGFIVLSYPTNLMLQWIHTIDHCQVSQDATPAILDPCPPIVGVTQTKQGLNQFNMIISPLL